MAVSVGELWRQAVPESRRGPESHYIRTGTEAQAHPAWAPPGGTLGTLVEGAWQRVDALFTLADTLADAAHSMPPVARPLSAALRRPTVGVVAEVKRRSP